MITKTDMMIKSLESTIDSVMDNGYTAIIMPFGGGEKAFTLAVGSTGWEDAVIRFALEHYGGLSFCWFLLLRGIREPNFIDPWPSDILLSHM